MYYSDLKTILDKKHYDFKSRSCREALISSRHNNTLGYVHICNDRIETSNKNSVSNVSHQVCVTQINGPDVVRNSGEWWRLIAP